MIDAETGRAVPAVFPRHNSFVWDADGRHGYVSRLSGDRPGIWKVDVQTGEEALLYQPPPDSVLGGVSESPDGNRVAFSVYLRPEKVFRMIVVPVGGGPARGLLDVPGVQGSLAVGGWTRDGRQIIFTQTTSDSEHKQHQGELWAVSLEGGGPHRLGLKMGALRDVRVSPDGTRISFTSGYPETDLWVFENFLPQTASR